MPSEHGRRGFQDSGKTSTGRMHCLSQTVSEENALELSQTVGGENALLEPDCGWGECTA